ncbi:complex I intermediate-associated protein 30-domain-containing protein [Endogone sp. FLAS-F59071]|nr:complex I intermediate-associated protein 30-domain-containing protein [Endogone sp. FLAS-F59071]|eukprot:RUS18391.1 complex I intermediate-associated protein 30-domain-containing protein [Endogone sp. FLAS-F59071]
MFSFLRRSASVVKDEGIKVLKMELQPWQKELPMAAFTSKDDLARWVVGCDRDIGGFSEAHLDITKEGKGRFWGNISLDLPANPDIERSGYAALRTKVMPSTIFGTPCWDTSLLRYLALRVRGDHRKYFVNIQTDGVVQTDLYQHRLFLRKPGEWETVMIPFRDFILTNNGEIEEQQIEMHRERVKTVGISLLDRQPGPFELELDWINAMNTETTEGDLDRAPRNDLHKVNELWDEVPDLTKSGH